jgi:hypothetical protein
MAGFKAHPLQGEALFSQKICRNDYVVVCMTKSKTYQFFVASQLLSCATENSFLFQQGVKIAHGSAASILRQCGDISSPISTRF